MRLHDDIMALRRELALLRRQVDILTKRDERRDEARPEVIRAVREKTAEAAWRFAVEPWEIEVSPRRRGVSQARQWVMFEVRELGFTFEEIGAAMGRNHSTIISGCQEERIRRGKCLPDNENSTKIEAGRNAVDAAPDPETDRNLNERCSMSVSGHYRDSRPKINSEHPENGVAE